MWKFWVSSFVFKGWWIQKNILNSLISSLFCWLNCRWRVGNRIIYYKKIPGSLKPVHHPKLSYLRQLGSIYPSEQGGALSTGSLRSRAGIKDGDVQKQHGGWRWKKRRAPKYKITTGCDRTHIFHNTVFTESHGHHRRNVDIYNTYFFNVIVERKKTIRSWPLKPLQIHIRFNLHINEPLIFILWLMLNQSMTVSVLHIKQTDVWHKRS